MTDRSENGAPVSRRRLLQAGAAASVLAGTPALRAQSTQPVRLVVGFAAGGGLDLMTRAIAEQMSQRMGRPVIVENRTGAAGRLAVDAVKTARPDGDTLLVCPQGPLTLFPYVFRNLRYDPFTDLAPIARLTTFDCAIGLGPSSGAATLPDFLAWARANPARANYGSAGNGTLLHFIGVSLSQRSGVPLTHVPYKGSALSTAAAIGGEVPMVVAPLSDMYQQHQAGRLKAVAITSPQRSAIDGSIPTCKEAGVDLEVPGWYAMYAPAGIEADAAQRLNTLVVEIMGVPAMRERMLKMGMTSAATSREQTSALQRAEHQMWGQMVKAANFTPED